MGHQTETELGGQGRDGGSLIGLGALLGLLAVGLGAFGSHGLEGLLEGVEEGAKRAAWWETAASYHLVHAATICALAAGLGSRARGAALAMAVGIAVFSGTLYAMALGAPRWFGAITPVGGVLLMVGWGMAAWVATRRRLS